MSRLRKPSGTWRRWAIVAAVFSLFVAACGASSPAVLTGMVREPAPDVGGVVLPYEANGGRDFTTRAEPGRLLLVYFGYTSCPDVCPTTLADLRTAVQGLGDEGERVDVAIITVDPDRDVPERVTNYLHAFFDDGHALRTGDPAQLAAAADRYGAAYEVTTTADGSVEVAHSAFLYVVDSAGRILVQWPFGTLSEDMKNDLAYLFAEGV